MRRDFLIALVALAALCGSLVAAGGTIRERDLRLRGYVDPTQTAELPFRVPRLGVNAELMQYDADELGAQFDLMEAAGVHWVRQFVRWDEIETAPGDYHWSVWDAIIGALNGRDLELVAVLMNSPAWAQTSTTDTTPTAPPDDPAVFARFAAAFAARYGQTINYYQIWDEPNLTAAWGSREPRAAEYAALLAAGYDAIHSADADATVIAAALAPTVENTLLNISDVLYLEDLYRLGAAAFMDAAAAKPYGFDLPPDDYTVDADVLNFSRIVLLREIMLKYEDGRAALWASNWGWNSLPADWTGAPSLWGSTSDPVGYTLGALDRADREWAWLGGMILQHWQPDAAPDDPVWGFSLLTPEGDPTPLLSALTNRTPTAAAFNGQYAPANAYARYSGVWTFGELGADIGWINDSQLDFDFVGSSVALLVRQDDYLAFLYPTIDGQPANAAPRDPNGNAFINLKSGSLLPELNLVPVGRDLPFGSHTLHIVADRGWDRWALAGFAVSSGDLAAPYNRQIGVALVTALVSAVSAGIAFARLDWSPLTRRLAGVWRALGGVGQLAISVITSLALMVGMLLTWGDAVPALFRREPIQLGLAIVTAGVIYVQPHVILTVIACLVLFVIVYHRVDLGLLLVIVYAPFFLFPVELWRFAFPMSELVLVITFAAWTLHGLANWGATRRNESGRQTEFVPSPYPENPTPSPSPNSGRGASTLVFAPSPEFGGRLGRGFRYLGDNSIRLTALDWGVIALVALGALSLLWAADPGKAVTDLRVMLIEPGLFYLILRTSIRDQRGLLRLIDGLLFAGALVAGIGLMLYFGGQGIITAEGGSLRLASVYGSPNNVGLFLGRCIPFALAYALASLDRTRRLFGVGTLILMGIAVLFSQSAGALFIGIPAAVLIVSVLTLRRRARLAVVGLAGVGAAVFAVAMQFPRFARIVDVGEGTSFFRVRVWQSALQMITDRPLTGFGLDQFLNAFRGRYMLPDAWQEPNLSHPHNVLLDFWVRLGIGGVLIFAWIQVAFWRAALRRYRTRPDALTAALLIGAMGSMINLLAHGLVDNSVFVSDLAYVFVLLLGAVGNLHRQD